MKLHLHCLLFLFKHLMCVCGGGRREKGWRVGGGRREEKDKEEGRKVFEMMEEGKEG